VLYHGTSSLRLTRIFRNDCLSTLGSGGARGPQAVAVSTPAARKFAPGIMARFISYRAGGSGMFTPGKEIYINSIEEREHYAIQGKMVKVYIYAKAADAERASIDPNLDQVQAEELVRSQLRLAKPRDPKIALTTERCVAEHWACAAAAEDQHAHSEAESGGVVLVLDGERLLELDHNLCSEGDSWQSEIACWDDVFPLDDVLIDVEDVTPQRDKVIREEGRGAVLPAPPLAGIELTVMSATIVKLRKGVIRPERTDAVVSALAALRSAMS
jgi:hypothetical protein